MNNVKLSPISPKGQITLPKAIRSKWGMLNNKKKYHVIISQVEDIAIVRPAEKDWITLGVGIGKKIYGNKDPLKELDSSRDSWDTTYEF